MVSSRMKRFHWVLRNFSSLQDKDYYSRNVVVGGCDWRLHASFKETRNGYMSLRLELADPDSLPSGWSKEVKFRLTLVNNKIQKKSNIVFGGQGWFDANNYAWGFKKFVLLDKLHAKGNGFLVRNKLVIVAEIQILRAITVVEDTVKITETLSCKEGNQVTDAIDEGSHDDDDDDASQEDSDDDGSSHVSDDEVWDTVKITEPLSCRKGDQATGEGSHDDDASQEELDDDNDGSSQVSDDTDNDDVTVKENLDDKFLKEIQPAKETVDVDSFQVWTSQVQSVSLIFQRHPDTALSFRPKNQQIRRAYMDELLRLIETLCQSPEKLSDDDLSTANETLFDLIDVGFKLDWLKTKLNEVSEKKKIEQSSVATLLTIEEQLEKLKNMVLDFESQLQKEKVRALAARTPLSFKDVVC